MSEQHVMPRAYWTAIPQWVLLDAKAKHDVMCGTCLFTVYDGTPILDYSKPVYFWSEREGADAKAKA